MNKSIIIGIVVAIIFSLIAVVFGVSVRPHGLPSGNSGFRPPQSQPPPPPQQQPASILPCNKEACNRVMEDYIVNKYWAFENSDQVFAECKNCPGRGFRSPMDVKIGTNNWLPTTTKLEAYDKVRLVL